MSCRRAERTREDCVSVGEDSDVTSEVGGGGIAAVRRLRGTFDIIRFLAVK